MLRAPRLHLSAAAALAVTAALGGLRTPVARAADVPPVRLAGFTLQGGQLLLSVGLQDLFGPSEREHLKSGFSSRVLIRVAVEDQATQEPVAVAVQRAEIVYDIWDEKFSVRTTRGLGAELRVLASNADEAIWRAATLVQFPVAETAHLRPGGRYVVLVRADLNPISEDLQAEVRRWLLQPARGQRRLGAGDSFFGSFVSIFVNPRIEDSDRQVRFVCQPFLFTGPLPTRPTPAPRGPNR